MQIDIYTRLVLTVIAASLFWLAFGPAVAIPAAQAESAAARETVNVNIVEIGGNKILPRYALPVEVEGTVQISPSTDVGSSRQAR
jgi:hypothetical protein